MVRRRPPGSQCQLHRGTLAVAVLVLVQALAPSKGAVADANATVHNTQTAVQSPAVASMTVEILTEAEYSARSQQAQQALSDIPLPSQPASTAPGLSEGVYLLSAGRTAVVAVAQDEMVQLSASPTDVSMRIRVTGSAILPFDSGKQQTLAAGLAGAVTASNFTITKDTVQVTGVYYVTSGRRRLQGSSSQQVDVVVSIDAKQAARMEDLKAAMAAAISSGSLQQYFAAQSPPLDWTVEAVGQPVSGELGAPSPPSGFKGTGRPIPIIPLNLWQLIAIGAGAAALLAVLIICLACCGCCRPKAGKARAEPVDVPPYFAEESFHQQAAQHTQQQQKGAPMSGEHPGVFGRARQQSQDDYRSQPQRPAQQHAPAPPRPPGKAPGQASAPQGERVRVPVSMMQPPPLVSQQSAIQGLVRAQFEQETRRMGLMDVLQYLGVDTSSGDPKKIRKAAFMQLHPDKTALVADPLERIRRTEGFKLAIAKGLQKL